tara:strand:+ start:1196 stop:2755 length:1560 start_codon:yes stop_codon:yes gene_type:complete
MTTAQSIYSALETNRSIFLDRARDASELTIPHLVPPSGFGPASDLPTPHNSIGARGINNLASKLLLALLPPNAPFFRLTIDRMELNKLQEENPEEVDGIRTELERALADVERAVAQELEVEAVRVPIFEAIRHLIVAGNALIYMPKDGGMRMFRMDRFGVRRDPMGNVTHIATLETVAPQTLPQEIQEQLAEPETNGNKEKTVDLYTAVVRQPDGKYKVWQEVKNIVLESTIGMYTEDELEYIPLRWSRIDGESYGRGFVEEYLGDFIAVNGLSRSILEGSVAAAKLLFLNNPNGVTESDDITDAHNGAVIEGRADDLSVLRVEKQNDFNVAQVQIQKIEERLSAAFLLNSSVVRQAERVTAEEIRMLSQELESALGGLYSLQAVELQLPIAKKKLRQMTKSGKLPPLPKDLVKPAITTGVEALGRGNDQQKLQIFIAAGQQAFGPQVTQEYVSAGEFYARTATSLGIESEKLVRSDEEVAQSRQQEQMAQMAGQLGPNAMKTASDQFMQQQEMAAAQE